MTDVDDKTRLLMMGDPSPEYSIEARPLTTEEANFRAARAFFNWKNPKKKAQRRVKSSDSS